MDLFRRGAETLIASWEAYARAAPGAHVHRSPGAAAAVFPDGPESAIYNNVLLERADALRDVEAIYGAAGVTRFAAWVHESDDATRSAVEARGYVFDSSTRAMAMELAALQPPHSLLEVAPITWADQLRLFSLPDDLLGGDDLEGFRLLGARVDGATVAAAMAFDHDGDCGIYNVGTVEAYRRRGLATALTARMLRDAAARGCTTASVQATPMAEGVYASVGFRDLGRYLEYTPR
jgi:ribosomal protein S18 acetylase RimI-like enzyme